jgi:phage protein D
MSVGAAILPDGLPDPTMPTPDSVQVVEAIHEAARYRLHYTFNSEDGDFPLLVDSHLAPERELAVVVAQNKLPKYLVCGPVTGQQIEVLHGGAGSSVEVLGGDRSVTMDRDDKAKVWNNVTDSLVVASLCADYTFVPDLAQTSVLHTDLTHALVQRESDLRFVRRLARRNGFAFWLTMPAPAVHVAHFKRLDTTAKHDVEFRLNVKDPNIDRVALQWDCERPVSASLKQVSLADKTVIDGSVPRSPLKGLGEKALGDVVKAKRSAHIAVPVDDAGALSARAEALLIDHGWFVSARITARLSVLKQVVRAHTVAKVTGLGSRHSGNYLVARVVHDIDATDHVMTVDLIRNAWN